MSGADPGRRAARQDYDIDLAADVLIIGGSLSGAWAALAAAGAGARVVLAEKGWMGTAGIVAAATGGGYYLLPDDPEQRARTIRIRHDDADGLDDLAFCEEVYEQSYRQFTRLTDWGFKPGRMGSFRGPDSMVFLRRKVVNAGVRVLDHSPALELLADADGLVAGGAGVNRRTGKTWRVRAKAVILATGGSAFRSGAMGTNGVTGDGYLFAAEAGASFVGMEFSGHYAFVPVGSSCTKGGMYHLYGQIFDDLGRKLDDKPGWPAVPHAAKAMMEGRKVFAVIDKAPAESRENLRAGMPNFFQYFDRLGVEPFAERWPVELLYEGTVRAAGGLEIDRRCATGVPGLFACGDITDKTKLTGAQMSGAGAAIAWCATSGDWAGLGAAAFARALPETSAVRPLRALGQAGLRPTQTAPGAEAGGVIRAVQDELLPIEKNVFRRGDILTGSMAQLDGAWSAANSLDGRGEARDALKAREAAAMAAAGRWIYAAALERRETRGLHRRSDFPDQDPVQRRNLRVGGLDQVWVRPEPQRQEAKEEMVVA